LKIPFKNIKPIFTISLLVLLSHVLFASGENNIFLNLDGLFSGLTIVCRFAALMFFLPLFTETASPREIVRALAFFGVNYRSAFIITSAFNLIPLFREEGRAVMDAQKLRGSLSERSFFAKIKSYPGMVVPLVLGAMRRAQAASVAMDSRAFGAFKTRTWLENPVMKARDYLFLAGFIILSFIVLFVNYWI